jgi:hypothetical protein
LHQIWPSSDLSCDLFAQFLRLRGVIVNPASDVRGFDLMLDSFELGRIMPSTRVKPLLMLVRPAPGVSFATRDASLPAAGIARERSKASSTAASK